MPSVTRPRPRHHGRGGGRSAVVVGGCRDPDALVDQVEAAGNALESLAHGEPSDPMKGVYTEMAAVVRRASKDVGRLLRDARG